jgi:FMN-dependent NADH-azoreductase
MKQLLHIDSSPRNERSHTRRLTREFVHQWRRLRPLDIVHYRDVGAEPPPAVTQDWIAAAFAPPTARTPKMRADLRLSDTLVDEVLAADVLVVGTPMYNFGIPAALKAYIDQIVRIGRTFLFEPDDEAAPYKPLTSGKRAFVIVASGDAGYEPAGRFAALNHVEPYLRTVFEFIGIRQTDFIYAGNDEFGGERLARALDTAQQDIRRLAAEAAPESEAA